MHFVFFVGVAVCISVFEWRQLTNLQATTSNRCQEVNENKWVLPFLHINVFQTPDENSTVVGHRL